MKLSSGQVDPTQPERYLRQGFTKLDSLRTNIVIGASEAFAAVPTGTTAQVTVESASWTVQWVTGDRITVQDASQFYLYDGTQFQPIGTGAGLAAASAAIEIINTTFTDVYNYLTRVRFQERLASNEKNGIDPLTNQRILATNILEATTTTFYTRASISYDLLALYISYDNGTLTRLAPSHYVRTSTRTVTLRNFSFNLSRNAPPWEERRVDVYADYVPRKH